MARPEAHTLGIIGTGREARAQFGAMLRVLPITTARAYSRAPEHRERFAREMHEKHEIAVEPVQSAEECVREADVVVTSTSASAPMLQGSWLREGTHIAAIGATTPHRRELDEEAIARAGTVVVESLPAAQAELGELRYAVERGKLRWGRVRELKDIVAGLVPGRTSP
ncbi:MAG: ornithine cyclodeaminase family protein, partial [Acetobacteraceae bacterium]